MFGLSVFITQYSIFITHFPNFVGLIANCFVWISFLTQLSKNWVWIMKIKDNFLIFSNWKMSNSGIIVNIYIFVGLASKTCLHQVSSTNDSLFLSFFFLNSILCFPFSFFFLLSPSPNGKPTFFHKFFSPFSLVLSSLFPSATEEQRYPAETLHLKENPETQQLWRTKPSNQRPPKSLHLKENPKT